MQQEGTASSRRSPLSPNPLNPQPVREQNRGNRMSREDDISREQPTEPHKNTPRSPQSNVSTFAICSVKNDGDKRLVHAGTSNLLPAQSATSLQRPTMVD